MTTTQIQPNTNRLLQAYSSCAVAAALRAGGFEVGDLALPDDADPTDNNWWTDPDIAASDDYPSTLLVGDLAAWKAACQLGVPAIPGDSAQQHYQDLYGNDPDAKAQHYPDATAFIENNWPMISYAANTLAKVGSIAGPALANLFQYD
ncbi:MAG TPA: hypothetical protein VGG19_02955 [Tepidisphaeraceae bacterium]|jgi:hypothetical protein